jgi:hypothetical protein
MIFVPAYDPDHKIKDFWEIGLDGFTIASWGMFPNTYDPTKKDIKRYFAPSTSILLLEKNDCIDIIAGAEISNEVIQNVMGYAMKQNKPLILRKCESLDNLRVVDHMVFTTNAFIKVFPKVRDDGDTEPA